jgi:hypothetical protein
MAGKNDAPRERLARFKETAKALECDEDKERFEAALGKIAKAAPSKNEPRPRAKGK